RLLPKSIELPRWHGDPIPSLLSTLTRGITNRVDDNTWAISSSISFLTSSGRISAPQGLQTKLFPTPMPIVESKAPLKTPVSEKLANTLLFRYPRKMDQNRILHFKYWIGILLGVIVLIIAEA